MSLKYEPASEPLHISVNPKSVNGVACGREDPSQERKSRTQPSANKYLPPGQTLSSTYKKGKASSGLDWHIYDSQGQFLAMACR